MVRTAPVALSILAALVGCSDNATESAYPAPDNTFVSEVVGAADEQPLAKSAEPSSFPPPSSIEQPETTDDSASLKEIKRWEWFMALVHFNADHAVDCGLRTDRWRQQVIFISHTEVADAGEYFALMPRLAQSDRSEWLEFRKIAYPLAQSWYGLPCSDFKDLPLLNIYDMAARGEGVIPVPPG